MTHHSSSSIDIAISKLLTNIETNNGQPIDNIEVLFVQAIEKADIKYSIEEYIVKEDILIHKK